MGILFLKLGFSNWEALYKELLTYKTGVFVGGITPGIERAGSNLAEGALFPFESLLSSTLRFPNLFPLDFCVECN